MLVHRVQRRAVEIQLRLLLQFDLPTGLLGTSVVGFVSVHSISGDARTDSMRARNQTGPANELRSSA